ncbi:SH3 domain-containing protein [Aliamphritea spongicola]|uniref:SH3 domain-containing protein n=1 Tax=Aliamphritea spongicola TaxID=707589 RepID=UPI00196A4089|nr:SH3 domain-containing protein [Aliamphritea spongicola]MBN3564715.1 SH3 domain-containing protein [Aliamphritea spongicola]
MHIKHIPFIALLISFASAVSGADYYVITNVLNVRNAPTVQSDVTGKLRFGEKVTAFETTGEWVKIHSDKAAWVSGNYLSEQPPTPEQTDRFRLSMLTPLLQHSDNYNQHKALFEAKSLLLNKQGTCLISDFSRMKGWWLNEASGGNEYFIYCQHNDKRQKIILNITTEQLHTETLPSE